jgi:hypothetical protein
LRSPLTEGVTASSSPSPRGRTYFSNILQELMAEGLNQSFVQGGTRGPVISIRQVLDGPPPEGDLGKGLVFRTNRGDYLLFCTRRLGPAGE